MDPSSKQEISYTTQHLKNVLADKTAITMAKLSRDDTAALDIAIIKATMQDEVYPKEKHVQKLKTACSLNSPRHLVNHVIDKLAKRLTEADGWLVALKSLMVFHRLFREVDTSFQDECLRYAERTGFHRMIRRSDFADQTTRETWDYSAWIRCYSVYLDERLDTYRGMKWDPEADGSETRDSKLKACESPMLLEELPQIQKLLGRLVVCVPEGVGVRHPIVILSCSMVLKEVRAVYKASCEGIINLADKFFEMDKSDAQKGLELYRENLGLETRLSTYFSCIQAHSILRGDAVLPVLHPLPADFLVTMEEYVKDAPKAGQVPPPALTGSATFAARGGTTSLHLSGLIVKKPDEVTAEATPPPAPSPVEQYVPPPVYTAPTADLLDFGDMVLTQPTSASSASAHAQVAAAQHSPPHPSMQRVSSIPPVQAPAWDAFPTDPAANVFGNPQPAPVYMPLTPLSYGPPHTHMQHPATAPAPVQQHPPPQPQPIFDPFNNAAAPAPVHQQMPPQQYMQPHQHMPPHQHMQQPPQPHMQAYHAPPMPAAAPAYQPAAPIDPFIFSNSHATSPSPYSHPAAAAPVPVPFGAGNPFGAAATTYQPASSPQSGSFISTTPPSSYAGKKFAPTTPDPLMDLSLDLFGSKPVTNVAGPTLRDLKATSGNKNFF